MFADHRHAYTEPFQIRETRDDPEPDPFEQADLALAAVIWEHLQRLYPGHPWEVIVEHRTGMASIYLQGFSAWGWHIRLADLKSDPGLRLVTKGGGELLERFRLPRSGLDFATFLWAHETFNTVRNFNRRPPE